MMHSINASSSTKKDVKELARIMSYCVTQPVVDFMKSGVDKPVSLSAVPLFPRVGDSTSKLVGRFEEP